MIKWKKVEEGYEVVLNEDLRVFVSNNDEKVLWYATLELWDAEADEVLQQIILTDNHKTRKSVSAFVETYLNHLGSACYCTSMGKEEF